MHRIVNTVSDGFLYGFAFALGWFAAIMLLGVVVVI